MSAIIRNNFLFLLCALFELENPQHHNTTSNRKMPMCTHLSNQILVKNADSQSSEGKAFPGMVNNAVEIISQAMAGIKEGLSLRKGKFSAILSNWIICP